MAPSWQASAQAPQPLHKNFQLLAQTLEDYQLKGYTLYILADSQKQQQRLKDIFASEELEKYKIQFQPVDKTIHEGFVDHEKKACFFTDHQIFDRFHKYNLRSDSARAGKMALTRLSSFFISWRMRSASISVAPSNCSVRLWVENPSL